MSDPVARSATGEPRRGASGTNDRAGLVSVLLSTFVVAPNVLPVVFVDVIDVIASRVDQEYFSPQGVAYVLGLALLAIVIPSDRNGHSRSGHFEHRAGGDIESTDVADVVVSLSTVTT